MASKYRNKPTEIDGIVFASRAESRRYEELKLLEFAGVISDLKCQPRYLLQEAFRRDGKLIRAIEYVGDYGFTEDGLAVCEDCKGMQTAVFKLKWKLALFVYPDVDFRIVSA